MAQGEEVIVYISNSQKDTATSYKLTEELKDKILNLYSKDFNTRMSYLDNGRIISIGIKEKK